MSTQVRTAIPGARVRGTLDPDSGGPGQPGTAGMRARVGLLLGPAAFAVILAAPAPDGMTDLAWRTTAVAALMAIWWVTEAVPIAAAALAPLVFFPILGIASIGTAAGPYANPVIFLFMGGFMIAIAIEECGLHRRIALTILRMVGTHPAALIGGFMAATGFLSMWISNTATVLMMLPMALSVVALLEKERGNRALDPNFVIALLLGLAYAANIGGMGTLIGTAPNALLAGFMAETYGIQIGFVQWMMVGVPLVAVAIPVAWFVLTRVVFRVKGAELSGGQEIIAREVAALGQLSRTEIVVGAITAMTAAAWITRPLLERWAPALSDAGIAITGALLLFFMPIRWRTGERAITWKQAERLPWSVLLLFGGGLSLAAAIQDTQLAPWIGNALSGVNVLPVVLVVATVTAVVVFLTELTSNTAITATFLPVMGALAVGMGAHPLLLTVPTALAASCAFMMPVATPPNAIVYGSERLTIPQMARAGLLLNLIFIALITLVVFQLERRIFGLP